MKMHTEDERLVIKSGVGDETAFNIKGSAKAFKILSDGLYSDKIRAVIRELAANARDAMIDAGKLDLPFEIHLPNRFEPWFAVKDFGIGLCHEDVMHLYSTYFESTKTESNNVTGCLGLGSKSPFAYVDSFTVESRWNGVKTLYSCFYNESGIPTIAVLSKPFATDEENGLEVKMAVKDEDMREFATKAAKELRRFDPAPIITGNKDYAVKTIKYWVEGTGWKLMKGNDQHDYYDAKISAVQGNVTYPVDTNLLTNMTGPQLMVARGLCLDLFFEIGELDVAASREALGYDEATIAAIKTRLGIVAKELPPLFQDKFTACKTLWDARILFKEIVSGLPHGMQELLSDANVGLKWKGQVVSGAFEIKKEDLDFELVMFERGSKGNRGSKQTFGYNGTMRFTASNDSLFFYDDLGHGSHSRMTHFLETNGDAKRNNYLVKSDNKKLLKKFSKALGNVKLQPVSNLAKRPKAELAEVRVTSKVLRYTGTARDRRDSWEPTELDLKTGGIYVMINRFHVHDRQDENSAWFDVSNFNEIVEAAKDNDIVDLTSKEIYGIRKGDVAKMKDDSGWVSLFDLIRDSLKTVIVKEKVEQIIADSAEFNNFNFDLSPYTEALDNHTFSKTSALGRFMFAYKYMSKRQTDRVLSIRSVANRVNFKLNDAKPKHKLSKLWTATSEVYPLISLLDHSSLRGGYYSYNDAGKKAAEKNIKSVLQYIDDIDTIAAAEVDKKAA